MPADHIADSPSPVSQTPGKWPFLNSNLDTADKNVVGYMARHYPVAFAIFIPACIVCAATFIVGITDGSFLPAMPSSSAATLLIAAIFPSLFISLIYVICFYVFTRLKMSKDFARRFAAIMGYTFSDEAPFSTVSGDIFKLDNFGQIYDIASGTYRDHPLRIFEYQFSEGSGKSSHTFHYTILEIQFAHPLPEMHVMKTATSAEDILTMSRAIDAHFSSPMKISLEGDFDKYYSVYAPPDTQIEDLEVMTPDLMESLVDHCDEYQNIGFECHDDKLYLHATGRLNAKRIKDFVALYSLVDILIPKLDSIS
jgi:hypothetical protein